MYLQEGLMTDELAEQLPDAPMDAARTAEAQQQQAPAPPRQEEQQQAAQAGRQSDMQQEQQQQQTQQQSEGAPFMNRMRGALGALMHADMPGAVSSACAGLVG